jgi:hypothetical protein
MERSQTAYSWPLVVVINSVPFTNHPHLCSIQRPCLVRCQFCTSEVILERFEEWTGKIYCCEHKLYALVLAGQEFIVSVEI